jgi:tRNA-Thr(GGU) m(6)t(6)A37 methyltransferase TsaA
MSTKKSITVFPIGFVRRTDSGLLLEIDEEYRPGMKQLDKFSHLMVLWWADKHDNKNSRSTFQCEPPYAEGHLTGVFASRAEYRPNPIAITTTKIHDVDIENGIIKVGDIDASDGTPILDLKAYFPVTDRVQNVTIPDWLSDWPEWMPDEGIGLYEE